MKAGNTGNTGNTVKQLFKPIVLTMLFTVMTALLSACVGSETDKYELKSPCVAADTDHSAQTPCARRRPQQQYHLG